VTLITIMKFGGLIALTCSCSVGRSPNRPLLAKLRKAGRRGRAHSGAAPDSLKAAAQLGIKYSRGWAESWNQVRRITIDAVYVLTGELDQG